MSVAGNLGNTVTVKVRVLDADDVVMASSARLSDQVVIANVTLWWSWTMATGTPAYLYTLEVSLRSLYLYTLETGRSTHSPTHSGNRSIHTL